MIAKIKKENKAAHVSALRHLIPILQGTNNHYQNIDKLPRIYPAVEYARTKDGEHRVKIYNGLVQIEVNHLTGSTEVEQIKQQVSLLPQTFAAFCGSSGRSVKIWVLFALPDGSLPKRESEMALFHAHAYRLAVNCYQPLLPYSITLKEPSLNQSCRMTLDEWLDIWLRDYLTGVKPSTAYLYQRQAKLYIRPALGSVRLDRLEPHTIQRFYNPLYE